MPHIEPTTTRSRPPTRRGFLGLASAGAAALLLPSCGTGGTASAPTRPWKPRNPLRIPNELRPRDGEFALAVRRGTTEILPGTRTRTWGVNGTFLGPTLRMRTGDAVRMAVTNHLPETTSMHWHGMLLPAAMDGGPHQPIEPHRTWRPAWTVENPASTLWYHPHPHDGTAKHVFLGVAGMIIVDDGTSSGAAGLPHDYGVDDIPCILQDRTIEDNGDMPFDTEPTFGQMGTDMLVNGTMDAYVELTRRTARFRLLNASNARLYHLGFADGRAFTLVGTDQGLVRDPVRLTRLSLGPAERAEIVVEFEPGERARLTTAGGDARIDRGGFSILEVRVAASAEPGAAPPKRLDGPPPVAAPAGATVRKFRLQGHDKINGKEMDMARIDQVVPAGAVEIWEIENTVYAHNFHIHGCEFTVLDRDGKPPETWEAGRKDTVHLPEKTRVRVAARFGRYADPGSPYMYHCHILRHEDSGMMGQFVTVEPGTERATPRTLGPGPGMTDDHGHEHG